MNRKWMKRFAMGMAFLLALVLLLSLILPYLNL
jgi:predicted nucleic acid-binding Zn ribbon protein